jgi:cellulose biosynthesis protein BcsQ
MTSNARSSIKKNGRVIAFASAKGGTGKTVLAASTALVLLRSGKSVLVIDSDFSTRGLSLFILGDILHTSDLLVRDEECLAEFFLSEVQLEEIRPRRIDRSGIEYHILFSNKKLWQSGVPEQAILSDMRLDAQHYIDGISRLLAYLRDDYDYIIIDTRGGYDFTSAVPALLSDTCIIVLEPDRVSLSQIQGFEKALAEFADNHKIRIPLRGFVVNKASFDPEQSRFVEELSRTYQIKTYGVIPADISCIRAYEMTDSPIVRFPYSDFAFWSMRAIEGFIAPHINWTNRKDVERFSELRKNIGSEWAGRKRTDKILSWLPFAQLVPIVAASLFYISYRYSPSTFALLSVYASVALFIIWSMVGSTLSGLEWLRLREVSVLKRKAVLAAAGAGILLAMLLMVFDVPQRIFVISLPPQALHVGEIASEGAAELRTQAIQVAQAWTRLAFETIDRSEGRISTDAETLVRKSLKIPVLDPMPESAKKLVSLVTRQIIDDARSRVQSAADKVTDAINTEAKRTQYATDAIVWILKHPRATVDTRLEILQHSVPKDLEFPSVFDILDTATHSILDAGRMPNVPQRPDGPPTAPR